MMIARIALVLIGLILALPAGTAADRSKVPREPILRIEAGMHTSAIWGTDADASGRLIATASDDKTLRLWDGTTGQLVRVIRPPIAAGNEGKLDAVALSPDGKLVAAGGSTELGSKAGCTVYIFDTDTGRMVKRFTDLPNTITSLTFSRDGARLAAGLFEGGLRVWSMPDGRLLKQDRLYGGIVRGLSWGTDGRLATTSSDGRVRLYDASLSGMISEAAPGGADLLGIAFSPDGGSIAIGYLDKVRVDVVSAKSLDLLFQPDVTSIDNNDLFEVAWSPDGTLLFAGGRYNSNGHYTIRRWERSGLGSYSDMDVGSKNTIMSMTAAGDNLLVGDAEPAWRTIDKDGQIRLSQAAVTADMRAKTGDAFTVSADGAKVRFGLDFDGQSDSGGGRPVLFDIASGLIGNAPNQQSDLYASVTTTASTTALAVADWHDDPTPKLNGKPLELEQYETSRSLAILPGNSAFVLGTDLYLRKFDAKGRQQAEFTPPATALGVNASKDGRVVVAAYDDGTVRWHRASDLKELLALFVHKDGKRWVAWTPSGYYMAGPGGEDLIGWHLNNGADQAADFYPASRFRDRFSRPDVVGKVLATLDESKALAEADAEASRKPAPAADLRRTLPPIVDILSPKASEGFSTGKVSITYSLRSPSGKPVTAVRLLVDGRPVETGRGLARIDLPASDGRTTGSIDAELPPHDVTVALVAETEDGPGPVASVALRWTGAAPADPTRPKLYALVVGTSKYDKADLRLGYAAEDAEAFGAALKAQAGGLYREAEVRILADAGRDDVADGLDWLVQATTSRDVAMLFFAGHGLVDDRGDFWYLPRDGDPAKLRRTAVPNRDITDALDRIPGKAILFLDACHSAAAGGGATRGTVDLAGLVNELSNADKGVVVYASSTGKELSLEDPRWAHGAYTYALLDAFGGKADIDHNGSITLAELDLYLAEQVKTLTEGRQHPVMRKPDAIQNIAIAATGH